MIILKIIFIFLLYFFIILTQQIAINICFNDVNSKLLKVIKIVGFVPVLPLLIALSVLIYYGTKAASQDQEFAKGM